MTEILKNIGNSYFRSWKEHDFKTLRSLFSEHVNFVGALGTAHGADECIKGLQGLASIMTDIVIQHMWADESDVITWYDFYTTQTSKPLPVANWCHIENGKITQIRVTFDPRPLLEKKDK